MSHMTESELVALNASTLPRDAPFAIQGVSLGFFSVARRYGAAVFNGARYTYIPATDELIRDDVIKWLAKQRKPTKTKRRPAPESLSMFPACDLAAQEGPT